MALVVGDAVLEVGEDFFGGDGVPVEGGDVPLDWGEAEVAGGAEDVWATGSVGGAEETYGGAKGVFEEGVGVGELGTDAGGGLPCEPGVGHGVVADEMSGDGYGAGELGALTDEAADHEEGGAYVVAGKDFEEALGGGGVGAVVVGEGDLLWAGRGDEGGAEELRAGREGGVGEGSGGGDHGCCGYGWMRH